MGLNSPPPKSPFGVNAFSFSRVYWRDSRATALFWLKDPMRLGCAVRPGRPPHGFRDLFRTLARDPNRGQDWPDPPGSEPLRGEWAGNPSVVALLRAKCP